ncbi:hypothetical protein [Vibrio anguillarum]|uniref:hypothetical protein n=1 Tax=Vibrio anguillarum TaxID=55601 RepID=UPI001C9D4EEE|nr:hypothetical protein [Vibrio anguillarum]MBY7669065.1 hypothetical protein [Vibrio anguillarum]
MFNFSNGFYMKRICLLLGLTLALAGCASTNTDASKFATLQNQKIKDGENKHSLMFRTVNGKKLEIPIFTTPYKATHLVSAGTSSLDIEVTHTSNTTEVVWASRFEVEINLVAGEKYFIKANETNWCINMTVVNAKGEEVSSKQSKPLYPFISMNHMKDRSLMERVLNKVKNAKCESI